MLLERILWFKSVRSQFKFRNIVLGLSLSLILRPTVSRPVCLGIKHPSGAYVQIFITVWQMRFCWCEALSLTKGQVCRLQLLLVLASGVIFGYKSRGTRDPILLSQIRDFPFRLLLRLAGLRWRYLTPPPHGVVGPVWPPFIIFSRPRIEHHVYRKCVGT
jgi:hypothetical protein